MARTAKIKSFDHSTVRRLREAVDEALEKVGQQFGVAIQSGNARFSSSKVTFKVEAAVAVARAVRPLVEAEGYPLADWSNPGGWWLFNMRLDKAEHLEKQAFSSAVLLRQPDGSFLPGPRRLHPA